MNHANFMVHKWIYCKIFYRNLEIKCNLYKTYIKMKQYAILLIISSGIINDNKVRS